MKVYEALIEAGQEFGIGDFGIYAMNVMRLEHGFRMWGAEVGEKSSFHARILVGKCDYCRGITRIHQSPSRPRPSMRPTAAFINIHEHLI